MAHWLAEGMPKKKNCCSAVFHDTNSVKEAFRNTFTPMMSAFKTTIDKLPRLDMIVIVSVL
jgi:hypothetical protein